jgi:hypothetical protein
MLRNLLMVLAFTVFGTFLTEGTAFADDQMEDGSYTIDGGDNGNDGSAAVTDGGTKIHFVSEDGSGATWSWKAEKKAYVHDKKSNLEMKASKKEDGSYDWKVTDTSDGSHVDRGTATPTTPPPPPPGDGD